MPTSLTKGGGNMRILDHLSKTKKAIGGVVAIIVCVIVIFYAGVFSAGGNGEPQISATTILNQLQEANEDRKSVV